MPVAFCVVFWPAQSASVIHGRVSCGSECLLLLVLLMPGCPRIQFDYEIRICSSFFFFFAGYTNWVALISCCPVRALRALRCGTRLR